MIYGTSSASFRATVHRTPNHSDFGSWHRWTGYRSIQRLAAAFRSIGAGRSARLYSRRIASSIASCGDAVGWTGSPKGERAGDRESKRREDLPPGADLT